MSFDPDAIVVRPFQAGDEAAVLRLHNRVLGDAQRGMSGISAELWRWKFLANPTGLVRLMLAEVPRHGVVGIYPTVPMRMSFGGRRELMLQAVDQAIAPEWLTRGGPHGLFVRLGQDLLQRWIGRGDDRATLVFGLPVVSWRSGAQHLGWQLVRDWDVCFRPVVDGERPRQVPADLAVHAVPRFDDTIDELFARLERGTQLTTVRDHTWLNWRYADHPTRRYHLFACRERATGVLRGIAVYGTSDLTRTHSGFVLDALHDEADHDTRVALVAALEAQARADRAAMLYAVWSAHDPHFLAWQELGYRVRGTPWFLAATSTVYDPVVLRQNWRFTLGDCDLV
ncbi:MAG: hypothetical protein JNK15_10640 [Planctomycetes bacterium]|nr:hypothetical protein [Planctomycetota bacterium]